MSDLKLKPIYELVLEHIHVCEERISKISKAKDFTDSNEGKVLFDAITMRLQAMGENVKRASKINQQLLEKYPEVQWDSIIRFRDYVSHHYELLDHEVVFDIAKHHLTALKIAIEKELNS